MTNAELAILSLIVEQPRHGYEIERVIAERGMRDWTEVGFSSIYYILKKLEKAGLVSSCLEQRAGRGPARKVYTATEAGHAAWHEATLAALSIPERSSLAFQLGLANLPGLDAKESIIALKRYLDGLARQIEQVRRRQEELGPTPPHHVRGMFEHSLTLMEAERAWMRQFVKELRAGAKHLGVKHEQD